jgi:hypothetical protein
MKEKGTGRNFAFRISPCALPGGLLVIGFALIIPVNVAHAYLDPGTGSYIIQILIGGLLGGVFAIGIFWKRFWAAVKRLFSGKKRDDSQKPT